MDAGVSVRDARPDEAEQVVALILEASEEFGDLVTSEFLELFRADAGNVEGQAPFTDLIVADPGRRTNPTGPIPAPEPRVGHGMGIVRSRHRFETKARAHLRHITQAGGLGTLLRRRL